MNMAGNQVVPAAFWAGKYIIDNWSTELIFCRAKIGEQIQTGECLKATPENNPVREAYRIYKHDSQTWNHNSYAQCTALFAVSGKSDYWLLHKEGGARMFLEPDVAQEYLRWYVMWDRPEWTSTGGGETDGAAPDSEVTIDPRFSSTHCYSHNLVCLSR